MKDPTNSKYNSLQLQCYEQRKEIDRLNERIKRLEEAGDALANTQTYDLLETVNWHKARGEAKP
jgi:flagellar motility protein MotE (MotC chaperone)